MNESRIIDIATLVSSVLLGLIAPTLWVIDRWARKWRELTISIHQRWHLESYLDKGILDDVKEATQLRPGTASMLDTSLARFTIGNTGRAAIQSGDFERALRFSFGQNARIQKARVTRTTPSALEQAVSLQQGLSHLEISPLLLNPNESLDIEVFGTNFDAFQPLVRIVGLSEIRADETKRIGASTIYSKYRLPEGWRGYAIGVLMLVLAFIVFISCIASLLALLSSAGQTPLVSLSLSTAAPVATSGSIVDTILNAIDSIVDSTLAFIVIPFFASSDYRRGFVVALILGFTISRITTWLVYWRALVRAQAKQIDEGLVFKYSDR